MQKCLKERHVSKTKDVIVAESKSTYRLKTYVSLFSSAGVGCYALRKRALLFGKC